MSELDTKLPPSQLRPGLAAMNLLVTIQELLDGTEWNADTLKAIADVMIKGGYRIRDREKESTDGQ